MAPTRPRALDDSRSETSSITTNLKDKAASGPVNNAAGVSKNKKHATGPTNQSKSATNGTGAGSNATEPSPKVRASWQHQITLDRHHAASSSTLVAIRHTHHIGYPMALTVSQIDWTLLPPSTLSAYRIAHHLPTAPSYTHPHADILYKTSLTAMRAPSQVQARKRMLEARQQQRQKAAQPPASKKKAKTNAADRNSDTSKENDPPDVTDRQNGDGSGSASGNVTPEPFDSSGTALPPVEQIERQNPQHLASAVRKHFNAQQLNEAETISRFIYVARNSTGHDMVQTEGSAGDGHGSIMGSHGREVRRGEGGEPGFRLRFRPG